MNAVAIIILITLSAELVLNLTSENLNLKTASGNLPVEFGGVFDEDRYRKSQNYLKVNTRFGLITTIFDLLVFLFFWFMKGFPFVDGIAKSFGYGPIISGIIFFGIIGLAKFIINLPFSLYSTFVIEEKFGFNNTTIKIFIIDTIKSILLAVIIGVPIAAAIIGFFQYTGEFSWLYCWGILTVFAIAMQYIIPTVIMPLFNKFEPVEEGELKTSVINYAESIQFPLQNLFVMDGSKRSAKSNAFFTGFGKNRRIVLYDTLIKNHTVNEIVAVLAHEMGHFKKKHIIKTMAISIVHTGILFFLLSIFLSYRGLYEAFYMDEISIYAGLIFFSILYSPVELFLGIFLQMYSRKNEYEADAFAAETTKMPEALINALKKLSRDNLSNLRPHPLYVVLNYSHPPVLKRIEQLKKIDASAKNEK